VTVAADVVAHLPGAVVAVDLEGRIRHWSSGAERIYGWSTAEAVGQRIRELILIGEHERADAVKARTHAGSEWVGEFSAVHKDGRRLVVWVSNAPLRGPDGAVTGIVAVSLDMTQHALEQAQRSAQLQRAHDRAERLADRQTRLMRVSEALGRALTPRQVVDVVLEQGVQALGADAGAVVGVAQDALEVLGSIGYEDAIVRSYDGLRLDARSPLTDVIRNRRPLLLDGTGDPDERYPRRLSVPVAESFAGIPLEIDGRTVGVMALSALRPAAFPEEDLEFLVTLGRQCAQALERGRLFSAERDARRRMAFLAMASARR
jgi:PAS domain S-box-containing protein